MKLKTKTEIIDYLLEKSYSNWREFWPISWNIKVYGYYAMDGYDGIENDPKWDEKWEEHLESEEAQDYFWWACEDWLMFAGDHPDWDIMEGHPDPAISATQPKFYTTGRSGGHLVLVEAVINGFTWKFSNDFRYPETWLECQYEDLWVLYKFCIEMDKIVKGIPDHMRYWYAYKRSEFEIEWCEQEKEALARAEAPVGPYGVNDSANMVAMPKP